MVIYSTWNHQAPLKVTNANMPFGGVNIDLVKYYFILRKT